jgi:hypothetical protein
MALKDEALNVVPPLENTMGVRAQARFGVTPACNPTLYRYLPSYFGGYEDGQWYTLKADMPDNANERVWVALSYREEGTIDPRGVGGGTDICWPLIDGEEMDFRVPPVNQQRPLTEAGGIMTAYATCLASTLQYRWLKMMGSASGYVVVRKSSVPEGGNAGAKFVFPNGR